MNAAMADAGEKLSEIRENEALYGFFYLKKI